MSDQAQGLRALVDRARRDHSTVSSTPEIKPGAPAVPVAGTAKGGYQHVITPRDATRVNLDGSLLGSGWNSALVAAPAPLPKQRARVVAVTSGKGGVGKTNFSSNLSLTLARAGQRIIVLDADLGLANLHVVLGVAPRYSLEDVMRGEKTLPDVLCDGPGGIRIIAGGSGITELANLDETTRDSFVNGLAQLDNLADLIILDTGAGLSRGVMSFLCAVEEIIIVTTPEPTAITDAYAMIKVLSRENPEARLMLVVNMAQSEDEANAVADRLIQIAHRFLNVELDVLGYIPQDPAVSRAVRSQQPFVISNPNSPAALGVARIAAQLGYAASVSAPTAGVGSFLTKMQRFFGIPQKTS